MCNVIVKPVWENKTLDLTCAIALKWMSLNPPNEKSTLMQLMVWYHEVTSHYLSQCWPSSVSSYGVTRPQSVNVYSMKTLWPWLLLELLSFLRGTTLQWRLNERDGVSNHQPQDCLLNRLFRRRSRKTSKLRVTGLREGNSPVNSLHKGPVIRKMFPFDDVIMTSHVTGGFPSHRSCDAKLWCFCCCKHEQTVE